MRRRKRRGEKLGPCRFREILKDASIDVSLPAGHSCRLTLNIDMNRVLVRPHRVDGAVSGVCTSRA